MARILLVLPLLGGAAGSASSPRGLRGTGMLMGTCEEGESVTCPGSGVSCAGNQCCPPTAASGNLTFPCPSASDSVQGCGQSAKLFDCLVGTCKPAESVRCPGSNAMCAGDQCCPGTEASGGQTFPCPSASNTFQGCGSGVKVSDCLATFTVVAANTGCRNFDSLPEIARFPGSVSNVFCAQKCAEMGCSFWTYQDEPNNVCEGLQPHPKPVQPALGDDACILFGGQCQEEENACWDVVLPSTLAPAPAPSPFIVLSPNTGCKNFASLHEIARFQEGVSNVVCAQKCAEMGCSFWTYQDEPNNVCEGLQPHPKPVQPALGDDACILFGGQCQKEENACWDVVTLSAPPAPSPPLFTVLSPNTGCKNFASLPELGRFKDVSNVFCAQACAVTKGCGFWTYQDDKNAVCEAQQPFPKPLQPALADDSCILFGGRCLKENNACWDLVVLSA